MKGRVSINCGDIVWNFEEIEDQTFHNWISQLTNSGWLEVTNSVDHKCVVIPLHAIQDLRWVPTDQEVLNGSTN